MSTTSKTWWGENFIAALEEFTEEGRLSRGRAYRSDKRVKQWSIKGSKVSAKIRGNANPYFGVYEEPTYTTTLELKQLSKKQWDNLVLAIGENAGAICKLMMNEMPDDIEQPFEAAGLYLLPTGYSDFTVKCTCPDYSVPCKHIAGVFYRLAEQLDHDPLLLFQLRGLSAKQLHKQLSKTPLGGALLHSLQTKDSKPVVQSSYFPRPQKQALPAKVELKSFWGDQVAVSPPTATSGAPIPALLIKKGGDYPAFWTRDNSFIEAMEAYYLALSKNGSKRL
jgi:uncharacterized Zn finger protein